MVTDDMRDVNGEKPSIHKGKVTGGRSCETGKKYCAHLSCCVIFPTFALADPAYLHLAPSWSGGLCPGGSLHGALRVSVYYSSVYLRRGDQCANREDERRG